MAYEIELKADVKRAISRLPMPIATAVLEFIRGPLADNPYRVGKALRFEWEGYFGARRGEYRIVYRIADERLIVEVVRVAHRRNAYRR